MIACFAKLQDSLENAVDADKIPNAKLDVVFHSVLVSVEPYT